MAPLGSLSHAWERVGVRAAANATFKPTTASGRPFFSFPRRGKERPQGGVRVCEGASLISSLT